MLPNYLLNLCIDILDVVIIRNNCSGNEVLDLHKL